MNKSAYTRRDLLRLGAGVIGGAAVAAAIPAQSAAASWVGIISLDVPEVSQVTGLPTQTVDCGPACVAMAVRYYFGNRFAGLSDRNLVGSVRQATGVSYGDTTFDDLERALRHFRLDYGRFASERDLRAALSDGSPVIALVNGAVFRGPNFGRGHPDHWIVIRGVTSASHDSDFLINDPDTWPEQWRRRSSLSRKTFLRAWDDVGLGALAVKRWSRPVGPVSR
jgi:ABC-type bacteriocin/lantibiotic exporter with double-glycine peptidase domain